MSFTLDIRKGEGVLLITAHGELRHLSDLLEYASTILSEAARHGTECILLDERDLSLSLNLQDVYIFAEEKAIDIRFGLDNRCISVCSRANLDTMKALERFLRNRAYEFKVVLDMEAAREWLILQDA